MSVHVTKANAGKVPAVCVSKDWQGVGASLGLNTTLCKAGQIGRCMHASKDIQTSQCVCLSVLLSYEISRGVSTPHGRGEVCIPANEAVLLSSLCYTRHFPTGPTQPQSQTEHLANPSRLLPSQWATLGGCYLAQPPQGHTVSSKRKHHT